MWFVSTTPNISPWVSVHTATTLTNLGVLAFVEDDR